MKNFCSTLIALLLTTLLVSCSKDDDNNSVPELLTAELFEDTSIMENSVVTEFRITFDKPAPADGYLFLEVDAATDAVFSSTPPVLNGEMEIPFQKGQTSAVFEFSPQDNELLQENTVVTFELTDSSEEIIIGDKRSSSIEIIDDEAPVTASFTGVASSVTENNAEGVEVRIVFSAPVPGEGSLKIQLEGNVENYFVRTYPALDNEQNIVIPIESGTVFTTFQVYPKDNSLLENHKMLKLNISEAGNLILKGTYTELNLLLLDDEIQGKLKSVETVGNDGKRSKKTWEYATDGKISKVLWEKEAGQVSQGTDFYYYSASGSLESVNAFPGDGEFYHWQNGRIFSTEKISGFFKVGYSTFEYDAAGKIQKRTVYTIKPDATFSPSARHDFEYLSDGNLKKESIYVMNNNNWILQSSLGFDGYTDKINPAPFEIIPTLGVQQQLPFFYSINGDGINVSHYYVYEYNAEGRVSKQRSLTATTTYSYY